MTDDGSASAESGLTLRWSPIYEPAWDATPDAYVEAGLVGWGRSRRLLRADAPALRMKAYVGVQHSDPSRWGVAGEPRARFFLSVLQGKQTLFLRTCDTLPDALALLRQTHARLSR